MQGIASFSLSLFLSRCLSSLTLSVSLCLSRSIFFFFSLSLSLSSPVPSKAKRLLDEGKISSSEFQALIQSDKSFREDEDVDEIPWVRISKDTMDVTGPLIVIEEKAPEVTSRFSLTLESA